MTTARVLPFFPHRLGRTAGVGGREPESPFRHLTTRKVLSGRQIVHRQQMLAHLYNKRASG
jgi:hypothetical protein